MAMNQVIGIVLLVLGLILLYFGWQASQSITDQVAESFTGTFTDSTMWFIIGGAVALVAGAVVVLRK